MICESMITPSLSASRRPARRRYIRWRCRACVPNRFIALTRCSTMRLPLQPTGWPRLIAPPSTFSLRLVEFAGRAIEAENLLAEFFVVPGGKTAQHLRRKRLVQLPGLDIRKRQFVALQQLGRRQHRAEAHDAGIERRPLAVENDRLRRQAVFGDGLFGSQDHPGRAVGDLRGIAGGDLAPGTLEHRLQFRQRLRRRVRPHAVVVIIELAVARECRLDLALEPAFRLRSSPAACGFRRHRRPTAHG